MLPEVIVYEGEGVPPTINDVAFTREIRSGWNEYFGSQIFNDGERLGMGAEDFGFFTTDPYIPSLYFAVGGHLQRRSKPRQMADHLCRRITHHSLKSSLRHRDLGCRASVSALLNVMRPDGEKSGVGFSHPVHPLVLSCWHWLALVDGRNGADGVAQLRWLHTRRPSGNAIRWGFVGSFHSRFRNFVRGPGTVVTYLEARRLDCLRRADLLLRHR